MCFVLLVHCRTRLRLLQESMLLSSVGNTLFRGIVIAVAHNQLATNRLVSVYAVIC
jgi:hypothetical protein